MKTSHLQPRSDAPIVPYPVFAREAGPRMVASGECGMGGPQCEDWVLEDGARISGAGSPHGLYATRDRRYMYASTRSFGAAAVIYDTAAHVRYHLSADQFAPVGELFRQVDDHAFFDADAPPSSAIAALLAGAKSEPYFSCYGVWMPASQAAQCPARVVTRAVSPVLSLSAEFNTPEGLVNIAHIQAILYEPQRRLFLNGEPTPYYCHDLDNVVVSEDGNSFMLRGFVYSAESGEDSDRFYMWCQDDGWSEFDNLAVGADGKVVGALVEVKSLAEGVALFGLWIDDEMADTAFVQTSFREEPFEVRIEDEDGDITCRVPVGDDGAHRAVMAAATR